MQGRPGQFALPYAIATALVLAVMALKSITDDLFGGGPPLILFLSAVMLAARFCGFGPGLMTTFLSATICQYFYFQPVGSLQTHSMNDVFRLGVFLIEGIGLSVLMQSLRMARRRAEQSEERFHLLIDSVQDYAIIMLDPCGRVVSWNVGAERIKGYRADEIIGRHFSSFYRPEDQAEGTLDHVLATVASGTRFEGEGWRVRKDGAVFWANVIITAVRDEAGQLKGFSKVTRDITVRRTADEELQHASEELARARDQALEASRVKSEFLANMSHEIRTPMNGVIGMTDLVLDTELTRDQRDSMELVKSSAESLLVVINDILDFSKIEAGRLELDPVDFELHDLVEDTLKTLAVRAHRKGLELTCDIDRSVPREVVGDPHRLRQILINLVGNAIKFTDRGEVSVRTTRSDHASGNSRILFAVEDTGVGIRAEKQRAIFDPFSQVDGSMARRHSGTGLGLTIASRLVAMMGGQLEVESKIGLGSTFRFSISLEAVAESARRLDRERIDLQGLRVLVVDDNATNRRIFDGMLRHWGAYPTCVESAPEAIAELCRADEAGTPYPLLLVDAVMPEVDGFMLVEQIRQETTFSLPAIMMLTSADQQGDATRCRQLGMSSYLVKPIKSQDLKQAITTVLAGHQTRPDCDAKSRIRKDHSTKPSTSHTIHVLLAEDNPVNQQVTVRFLRKQGHHVTVVEDGKQACAAAAEGGYDLILMDVQMPEMNGIEATQAIRRTEAGAGRRVPIVAVTAHAMKGDRERCLEAGMDDYISKPIYAEELLRVTKSLTKQPLATKILSDVPSDACPYDRAAALENIDGEEDFLAEIIGIFLDNLAPRMNEIRGAYADRDLQGLYRAVHTLRGAASNLVAGDFMSVALHLEEYASHGDIVGMTGALAEFECEVARLAIALASDPVLTVARGAATSR